MRSGHNSSYRPHTDCFLGVVILALFSGIGMQQVLILRTSVTSSWSEIAPNRKVSDFKYSKDDEGTGDFDAYEL